jgi:hypothetical protein
MSLVRRILLTSFFCEPRQLARRARPQLPHLRRSAWSTDRLRPFTLSSSNIGRASSGFLEEIVVMLNWDKAQHKGSGLLKELDKDDLYDQLDTVLSYLKGGHWYFQ